MIASRLASLFHLLALCRITDTRGTASCELVVFEATAVGTEKDGMLNGQSCESSILAVSNVQKSNPTADPTQFVGAPSSRFNIELTAELNPSLMLNVEDCSLGAEI